MAPISSVRIRLRYPDLDTFVERFAPNVTRGGVFLASRNIQAVGAVISFEIQLQGGQVGLAGQGKVIWVKDYNPAEPNRPYGMGVQFLSVEAASKPILARILRVRESGSHAPRRTTAELAPLGAAARAPAASGASGPSNGKPTTPAIDTSVDLAAEYGLEENAVRRMIDRTWMTGARGDDDLADLLKPDPVEPATLAQALVELPRLLDPQYSRRRASAGFRPSEPSSMASASAAVAPAAAAKVDPLAESDLSQPAAAGRHASDATDMTGSSDAVEPIETETSEPTAEPTAEPGTNGRRGRKRRR